MHDLAIARALHVLSVVLWIGGVAMVTLVLLGLVALRPGRAKRVRAAAWIAAQIVFGYIVAVAFSHNPLPYCRAC
ncbi:MAG TPA: SirB2 family protein [Burkholderiales bacterium]